MDGQYSVCLYSTGGVHTYVKRFVDAEEAFEAFNHYTKVHSVARIVIVDGLDHINYEWKKGVGITFPKEGQGGQDIWD